jgi:hypothetical protein
MNDELEDFVPESMSPTPPPEPNPGGGATRRFNWALIAMIGACAVIIGWWGLRVIAAASAGYHYKGQGWEYQITDMQIQTALSYEMNAHYDAQFTDKLQSMGNFGWELVSAVPSPRHSGEKGVVYRLMFKRPCKTRSSEQLEAIARLNEKYKEERLERALEAEAKARKEQFEREMKSLSGK